MKIFLIVLIVFTGILSSCNSQTCEQKPSEFYSYKEVFEYINHSKFDIIEEINPSSDSNWIYSLSYYSCDGVNGYMLMETKRKTYIFKDVPLKIWIEFKNSDSHGKYYHRKIKGKYQLNI